MRSIVIAALLSFDLLVSRVAVADNAAAARTLFKRGLEEYKAKKFGEASITLLKSYELDPKQDTLFALAQAERLDGRCPDAVDHYKKLLEQTTDLPIAKAIGANLELCSVPEKEKPVEKPVEPVRAPAEPPPKPQVITKTVVRTEKSTDKLTVALFSTGALAIGGSAALFLQSRSSREDSDRATSLDESNRLYDRSKREQLLSLTAAGVGVACLTVGVIRVVKSKPSATEVAIAPSRAGVTFAVSARW